jgi:hypothetical protein
MNEIIIGNIRNHLMPCYQGHPSAMISIQLVTAFMGHKGTSPCLPQYATNPVHITYSGYTEWPKND